MHEYDITYFDEAGTIVYRSYHRCHRPSEVGRIMVFFKEELGAVAAMVRKVVDRVPIVTSVCPLGCEEGLEVDQGTLW